MKLPDHLHWLAEQPYAHRGLHDEARPENTLGAFEAAINAGQGVELDVQPSADGVPMVFHDEHLKRLTGIDAMTASTPSEVLRTLPVADTSETIPTLPETLALIADRVPVLIEIKNDTIHTGVIEEAVATAVQQYQGRAAVMSWNIVSLYWFRRHAPDIPRGLVTSSFARSTNFSRRWPSRLLSLLPRAAITDAQFLAHDVRNLPSRMSKRFRRAGKPVLTWTVRSKDDQEKAARFADAPILELARDK